MAILIATTFYSPAMTAKLYKNDFVNIKAIIMSLVAIL